jgi:hypothetical protein
MLQVQQTHENTDKAVVTKEATLEDDVVVAVEDLEEEVEEDFEVETEVEVDDVVAVEVEVERCPHSTHQNSSTQTQLKQSKRCTTLSTSSVHLDLTLV